VTLEVDWLGQVDYAPTYAAMQRLTQGRTPQSTDLLWICEHPPVYTQGLAGKADHVLNPGEIPVVQTDRGGQVTYHGPGQVVAYPLIDLKRAGYYVKEYVYRIEES
jgi:lipoyl(octanoyl) transferase